MTYRPSPELIAANAALVHFLKCHPEQRFTAHRESPADTAQGGDVGRQVAAPREEGEGDGSAAGEGNRGKGKGG